MSFVIIVGNSEDLESFFFSLLCLFICLLLLFVVFIYFYIDVKTWKVNCYSLPFFLLPICNGKNFHRIEHTKRIKQGQDCKKIIARKSLRIYIFIYLFLTTVFSVFDLLDSFNLENVWCRSIES